MLDAVHRLGLKCPQYFGGWICLREGGINFLASASRFPLSSIHLEREADPASETLWGFWSNKMENIKHFSYYYDHNRSSESGPVESYCMGPYTVMGSTKSWYKLRFSLSDMYCMCKFLNYSNGTVSEGPRVCQSTKLFFQ